MSTAIRLKKRGRKKQAFYRVIVIDSRKRRDGRPIQDIGFFNPHTDECLVDLESYEKWLGHGAQPSDRVKAIVKNFKQLNEQPANS